MELNKEVVSQIASIYGMKAEELTAKLTSETPEELKLAGQLFTEDELKARDSSKYNEGKTAGSERQVKDAKQKFGYELDGVKDLDGFLAHHEEQLKAKYSKNSNERVTELENDINKLKSTYEDEIEGLKATNSQIESKWKQQAAKNKLLSIMPKETTLKSDAIITLFNSEYQLDEDNGKVLVKQNGEVLKDPKTTSPLELSNVFNDWLVKEKYIKNTPGRGDGSEFGKGGLNGIKSIGEFQKQWQKQNPDQSFNTPKYDEDYAAWRKVNTEVTA